MGYGDGRPRQPSGRRRTSGGPNRNLLIIGVVVVAAVVAVAVVVVVVTTGGGGGGRTQAAASEHVIPKVYVPTPANSLVKKLNERSHDKRSLNKSEVFGDQAKLVKHGSYSFKLVGSDLSDCASAAWGDELQSDLRKYGCTQLARGAYMSQDNKYLGQFVAMNLENYTGAQQIVRDLDPNSSAGFVTPLAVPGSPKFSGGFNAAYSEPFGHYVVISWVERVGGVQPETMNELLDASIAIERADDFVWERLVLVSG
jgi:hypothetical protein